MIIGAALIFGALFLFIHNQNEATKAETMSGNLMPQLVEIIEKNEDSAIEPQTYTQPVGTPIEFLDPSAFEMTEVVTGEYVGKRKGDIVVSLDGHGARIYRCKIVD